MASCYGNIGAPSGTTVLPYLPLQTRLPGEDRAEVELDYMRETDYAAGHKLLNLVIDEGLSWPFEDAMDLQGFKNYFCSHAAFVLRSISLPKGGGLSYERDASGGGSGEVLGAFYIKPNFPGRCSHICNGGFITAPHARRRGVGFVMGFCFLRLARDLGYRASYFNLVFRSNEASVALWRRLGFTELAVVPRAARLKGIPGLVDAIQFHYNLEELDGEEGETNPGSAEGRAGGGERKAVEEGNAGGDSGGGGSGGSGDGGGRDGSVGTHSLEAIRRGIFVGY